MARRGMPVLVLAGCGFLAVALAARAEDAGPPPKPGADGAVDEAPEVRDLLRRMREINLKRKNAGEITDEDRAVLEKASRFLRERAAKRAGDGFGGGGGPGGFGGPGDKFFARFAVAPELQPLLTDLNVVDRAKLTAACAQAQAGQRDEALAKLEKVVEKSPDKDAAGVARYLLARMRQDKGDPDAAAKALRAVTGRAAGLALAILVEQLMRKGDPRAISATFKELLQAQPTALDRCRLLKALSETLERPMPDALPLEARGEVLAAAAELVPYAEALASREALAKESAANPRPPLFVQQNLKGPFGLDGPAVDKGADGPRKFARKFGEGERTPEQVQGELKRAEDLGMKEDAERLRKELDGMKPQKAKEDF